MSNWVEEVFAPIEAEYRNQVMMHTWGHLSPKKNITYRGHVLFTISTYGAGASGIIDMQWQLSTGERLDDSLWMWDMVNLWIDEFELEEGAVYIVIATMRNYRFWGKPMKINSIESWVKWMKESS